MQEVKIRFKIELDGKLKNKSLRIPIDCYNNKIEWIKQYFYLLGYNVGEVLEQV